VREERDAFLPVDLQLVLGLVGSEPVEVQLPVKRLPALTVELALAYAMQVFERSHAVLLVEADLPAVDCTGGAAARKLEVGGQRYRQGTKTIGAAAPAAATAARRRGAVRVPRTTPLDGAVHVEEPHQVSRERLGRSAPRFARRRAALCHL